MKRILLAAFGLIVWASCPVNAGVVQQVLLSYGATSTSPSLISHTIFGCAATCTSGSATSPIVGAAINTTGAALLVASITCSCTADFGQGLQYTFSDNQSNTWAAMPAKVGGSSVTKQLLYVLSPLTSASHTFTVTNSSGGTYAIEVAAFSNMVALAGYIDASSSSSQTIQPGSLTPASTATLFSGVGFKNGSGTAPTVDSGLSTIDSVAANTGVNSPSALGYVAGAGSSINPTWTTTGGSAGTVAAWAASFDSSAGSSVSPPTLRGSGASTSSASSYSLNWPTGTVAGDGAIVMCGHGFACNRPIGWGILNSSTGANWNGAMYTKLLNAGDITTGHVTVTTSGGFDGYLAIATFVGAVDFTSAYAIRYSLGGVVTALPLGAAIPAGSNVLYFSSNRAVSTNTVNVGSQLQQGNDGSAASGALYQQAFSTANGTGSSFNFSSNSGSSGMYLAIPYASAASSPATSPIITGQSLGTLRSNFSGCVGTSFQTTATSDIVVTDLGRWIVSGNSATHLLSLIDLGSNTVLASVTLTTSGATPGAYAYASIFPVTLAKSTNYAIYSSELSGGDQWYDNDTTITFNSTYINTALGQPVVSTQPTCTSGAGNSSATHSYVPPNFKYHL